jgi:2-oxo-4-hydroxy-4-carboxy-5-ureidoimidazoline decarboxylase
MSDTSIEPTEEQLRVALGVERWVADVFAAGPFADLDALLDAAAIAANPLLASEIDEALAHHPRIGERASGAGAAAEHSRREQAVAGESAGADEARIGERLVAGNAAYEQRFGRIFLIRALGRSRAEIVDELERRLTLDQYDELVTVGEQLREIALLRLTTVFASEAA